MEQKKLFIIDGMALLYRAFHAIPPTLQNSRGLHTNAIYGFTQSLRKILKDYSPHYLAVAFDVKGPTLRHVMYEDYKAERPPMPDLLSSQIPYTKKLLKALHIDVLEKESFEADDIIAAVVKKAARKGIKSYIISGDKDLFQLVGENTVVLDYLKGREYGAADVEKKFGVGPARIKELMGLAGDSSDNIPNVPGVGVKTAAKLIRQYGTLENLFEHIEDVSGEKLKKNLLEYKDQTFLSRDLATLRPEVPVELELENFRVGSPDYKMLAGLFKELGFEKMLREILSRIEPDTRGEKTFQTIDTKDALAGLGKGLKGIKKLSLCLFFSSDKLTVNPELLGLALAADSSTSCFIPVGGENGVKEDYFLPFIKEILEDGRISKVTDSSKALYSYFEPRGVNPAGIWADTSIAAYLINPSSTNYGVEHLTLEYLDKPSRGIAPEELKGSGGRILACQKACDILLIAEKLHKALKDNGMEDLYRKIDLPLSEVLASMEIRGIKIDLSLLNEMSRELETRLSAIKGSIYRLAGTEFNINSPKQLSQILFDRLKLNPVKRTKTGFSTNEEVLKKLSEYHEVPEQILEYRGLSKLKSTYVDALIALAAPGSGRIHTSFNQTVTATGRLSSTKPNLQNIPVRGDMGPRIREAFVADEGFTLLSADYSQIELRIVAHMAGDPALIEAFKRGEDIHSRTASEIFGLGDPGIVTPELRRRAKAINFGIIYGMGPYGLSTELGISMEEAGAYIENYFAHYQKVREFVDRTVEDAAALGYTTTLFGRRRFIPELSSPVEMTRRLGRRLAINTPVQGTAADIIKAAMVNLFHLMKEGALKSRMLLQIHDELLFEVARDETDRVAELVKKEMEGVVELSVPVKVNLKSGPNWRKMEPRP
ncbi:MAG: DNA polymerase I [Thermodesulfobacteriota bacterium]